ncbi:RNA-binding protein 12B-like isoform X1 [Rhinatrema bivittatum]|uniref:RNA-binding protein 12B-like isoform X1 n=1 Tax=Rhinatrema bivittatum TaxID=194408 RepID=UPI00112E3F55|nr:RNA-binding protein 12B-like isoform X1 [Rhinatrema bivittatum]XP_029447531.1 RNA-binding protein 12B-like isoform X1 [Rhinatrema bivittatum]XP_029447532.1 RNA-binding protein 12B-like isoform X1 [Rhinatrema bivittatum]XP_029447533.1 RNA-binding protein 12B-like isoform X1 [Rhinatrema bivittatum]XP_029447534.1 RNA-binding protein 12B-like isoform X1 [Rhinatrema bivittatum]XP_029447535.1 RNA-binding protein 12B-like isoform X1 [Rhinatrema bivittatum]XP_029447536.1 RNA-binding protein 12B-li
MAVVLRLQGLPVSAGTADVRRFFKGLTVPDGGVHIIGGKLGEAFIIFATDEDARLGVSRSGGFIKQSTIKLFLSSKTQMQKMLEMNQKRNEHGGGEPAPAAVGDKNILNLVASIRKEMNKTAAPSDSYSEERSTRPQDSDNRYLFLHGLPYTATVGDVKEFFKGLHVVGVLFLLRRTGRNIGLRSGEGLVKFASSKDALEGLKLDKHFLCTRFIQITRATKEQWDELCNERMTIRGRSPVKERDPTRIQSGEQSQKQNVGRSKDKTRSRSPRNEKPRSRSSQKREFYIHMRNLPYTVEKRDLKLFFYNLEVSDNHIKFLYYSNTNRRTDGFVLFRRARDYHTALGFHKKLLNDRMIYIYPIARKSMLELFERIESADREKSVDVPEKSCQDIRSGPRLYIYIRNFPFDVTKVEVQKFFVGFSLTDDDIYLLYDEKGVGLGEALVTFRSEELAAHAENLNRQRFLGTEVLLQRISEAQIKEFGINAFPRESSKRLRDHSPLYGMDRYPRASSVQSLEVHDDFRHNSEESRSPRSHMDYGSNRFDMRNNGLEGKPEGKLRPDHGGGNPSGSAIIRLKNMPFTTTVNEILDFFYGFRLIPDSISIQHESGFPTGVATVAMENADEAMAAIRELHGRPVGPRRVKLSLV